LIPFLDLKAAYEELDSELDAAVLRASRSGWYIGGPEVETFETDFAHYVQANYCVGVGNGLDALTLALRALDVGPGDEVIVPSHTFIATWLAVSAVGATPVPVEPIANQYHLSVENIESKISSRTKVILPVHLYGIPVDIKAIVDLARKHKLYVVEDAAQAHGAAVNHQRIGAHGDIVAWSFYPGKNLGALGDGGAITTQHGDLAQRVKLLGNYGSSVKYYNAEMGVNSRLDPIQAAVLAVKLKYLDDWNARRQTIAAYYHKALSGLPLQLPHSPEWAQSVWHLYVVSTPNRAALQTYLLEQGVQTLIHYPVAPHMQAAYQHLGLAQAFPLAKRYAEEVMSLPIGPQLTQAHAETVVAKIKQFYG
jgi:dTDP-4-amino-4,6-dideoxygalactose transaminase